MPEIDIEALNGYLEECKEHLEQIENQLLELEKDPHHLNDELINTVFRAAHSIKGGAGFFHLDKVQELGHSLENTLDKIRAKKLRLNSEITTLLLQGFDLLRSMILDYKNSNETNISEIINLLNNILGEPNPISSPEVEKKVNHNGKFVYSIEYPLGTNLSDDLFAQLQSVGEISSFNPESGNQPLRITLKTVLEFDFITTLTGLPASQIHILKTGNSSKSEAQQIVSSLQEIKKSEDSSAHHNTQTTPHDMAVISSSIKNKLIQNLNSNNNALVPEESTLRISVKTLESLMNLAGELVLSRNQLVDAIAHQDFNAIKTSGTHVSMVTSELQEIIMQTRMQPIGNVFSKYPRIIRELSRKLGKEIILDLQGKDVELDKTIIEGLSDPLTHMVRNAVDHGIEKLNARKANGKTPEGHLLLNAYHEAGQVVIELKDDGAGINGHKVAQKAFEKGLISPEAIHNLSEKQKQELIFLPGLSTANEVTDISGRGVGMDVVKSNIDKLGGKIEIESIIGHGSTFRIKLPLTLAIIPSLVVTVCDERYAIPQVNVLELIRIPAAQVFKRIEVIGNSEVLSLRGELLPIVHLADALEIPKTFIHPETDEVLPEKRSRLFDRRSVQRDVGAPYPSVNQQLLNMRSGKDRRYRVSSDLNIAILNVGQFKYGLVVDDLHDTVEIVVKPLDSHLKNLKEFAGATIMGDGKVSLIIDAAGLAQKGELQEITSALQNTPSSVDLNEKDEDMQNMLVFRNAPHEVCTVPLDLVARVEQIENNQIEDLGGKRSMQYRGGALPLVTLADGAHLAHLEDHQTKVVIIFKMGDREAGLLAATPLDVIQTNLHFDEHTLKQKGIAGSTILNEKTTLLIDIYEVLEFLGHEWSGIHNVKFHKKMRVLLAEDSPFFRTQVKKYLVNSDFEVTTANNGEEAWQTLHRENGQFDLLLTDVEMPLLTGLELTKRVRNSEFANIPIIALTSLSLAEDRERGFEAGVDGYEVKLDRDRLLKSISQILNQKINPSASQNLEFTGETK